MVTSKPQCGRWSWYSPARRLTLVDSASIRINWGTACAPLNAPRPRIARQRTVVCGSSSRRMKPAVASVAFMRSRMSAALLRNRQSGSSSQAMSCGISAYPQSIREKRRFHAARHRRWLTRTAALEPPQVLSAHTVPAEGNLFSQKNPLETSLMMNKRSVVSLAMFSS